MQAVGRAKRNIRAGFRTRLRTLPVADVAPADGAVRFAKCYFLLVFYINLGLTLVFYAVLRLFPASAPTFKTPHFPILQLVFPEFGITGQFGSSSGLSCHVPIFSARCIIYTSRAYATMSVSTCLSVCL